MINGDVKPTAFQRLWYFVQCLNNHRKGSNKQLKTLNPHLSLSGLDTNIKTPSRLLCDAFWNSIDFSYLEKQLGAKLHILDLGCGSGLYGIFLARLSKQSFGSYTGLDIYKHENFPTEFKHILAKAEDAKIYINQETNLIVSQSALEHIEYDEDAVLDITRVLLNKRVPFMQIHLVPAAPSLWLYLRHGWRQYSRKNLAAFGEALSSEGALNVSIAPIGGSASFWAHLKNITLPNFYHRLIRKEFRWYQQDDIATRVVNSVASELHCTPNRFSAFWALIVSSDSVDVKFKS